MRSISYVLHSFCCFLCGAHCQAILNWYLWSCDYVYKNWHLCSLNTRTFIFLRSKCVEAEKRNLFHKPVNERTSGWMHLVSPTRNTDRIQCVFIFCLIIMMITPHTQTVQSMRKSPKHHPHLLFLTLKVLYISILHSLEFSSHLLFIPMLFSSSSYFWLCYVGCLVLSAYR